MDILVYVSVVQQGLEPAQLQAILAGARRHNGQSGITGVLLKYAGHFIQAIEGPPDALDECYARICADPRHHDVTLLQRRPVVERHFPGWSMREVAVAGEGDRVVEGFFTRLVAGRADADVEHALALLRALALREPGAAAPA
jgi:hypothetical protein